MEMDYPIWHPVQKLSNITWDHVHFTNIRNGFILISSFNLLYLLEYYTESSDHSMCRTGSITGPRLALTSQPRVPFRWWFPFNQSNQLVTMLAKLHGEPVVDIHRIEQRDYQDLLFILSNPYGWTSWYFNVFPTIQKKMSLFLNSNSINFELAK